MNEINDIAEIFSLRPGATHLVGVHISIPDHDHPLIACSYPPHALGATYLCQRVLENALERASAIVGAPWFLGFFNESTYIFQIKSLGTTLKAITDELGQLSLLSWAQVAWWCRAEDIWRTAHPTTETPTFARYTAPEYVDQQIGQVKKLQAAIKRALS